MNEHVNGHIVRKKNQNWIFTHRQIGIFVFDSLLVGRKAHKNGSSETLHSIVILRFLCWSRLACAQFSMHCAHRTRVAKLRNILITIRHTMNSFILSRTAWPSVVTSTLRVSAIYFGQIDGEQNDFVADVLVSVRRIRVALIYAYDSMHFSTNARGAPEIDDEITKNAEIVPIGAWKTVTQHYFIAVVVCGLCGAFELRSTNEIVEEIESNIIIKSNEKIENFHCHNRVCVCVRGCAVWHAFWIDFCVSPFLACLAEEKKNKDKFRHPEHAKSTQTIIFGTILPVWVCICLALHSDTMRTHRTPYTIRISAIQRDRVERPTIASGINE